jgi:hypothetical protein
VATIKPTFEELMGKPSFKQLMGKPSLEELMGPDIEPFVPLTGTTVADPHDVFAEGILPQIPAPPKPGPTVAQKQGGIFHREKSGYFKRIKEAAQWPGAPIEKADRVLHATLDAPVYLAYKGLSGRPFGKLRPEITQGKTFEQALLNAIDYEPSRFTKIVGDIVEFSAGIKSSKELLASRGVSAPGAKQGLLTDPTFLQKAHYAGRLFAIPEVFKGLGRGLRKDKPLEEALKGGAAGYATGVALEGGTTLAKKEIARAGRGSIAYKAAAAARKQWQKVIDIPVRKIKALSSESYAGRFRDMLGETFLSFYKRAGTFKHRLVRARGEMRVAESEIRRLNRQFAKITNTLDDWGNKPEHQLQLKRILTGKATNYDFATLPNELHGWTVEYRNALDAASIEAADIAAKMGKPELAKSIRKNLGVYLPRLYEKFEKPSALRRLFRGKKAQVYGSEFKVRRDAWTAWKGKKLLGKYETEAAAKEAAQKAGGRIKAPLTPAQLAEMGEIDNPIYLLSKGLAQTTHDTHYWKFLNYAAKKWGQKAPEGLSDDAIEQWAKSSGLAKMPRGKGFENLKGMYIPKGMADDILGFERSPGLFQELWNQYLGLWKESKVVWNPSTHGRNIMGNIAFSDLAGNSIVNPKNWTHYKQGAKILADPKSEAYKNLVRYNAIGSEYYGADIKDILRGTESGAQLHSKILQKLALSQKTGRGAVGKVYALEDQIYKAAAYAKYTSEGMKPSRAAAEVNKWFPNYDYISKFARVIRQSPVGAPFLSFVDQSAKIAARGVQKHPLKVAKYAALPGFLTMLSTWRLGISPTERDILDANRSYFEPIVDRGADGRVRTLDLRWIIPLANDIIPSMEREGIDIPWALEGPMVESGVSLLTGRDLFTGRALSEKDASKGQRILDMSKHIGRRGLPIPSFLDYGPRRLKKAWRNEGRREGIVNALSGVLTGINVRAPYIQRARLYAEVREELMNNEPDSAIEKIVLFNNTYKSERQPMITADGLRRSILYHTRKEYK